MAPSVVSVFCARASRWTRFAAAPRRYRLGVLHCLYRHGLRVPQDIAIASIDNLDISAFAIPALTTVDIAQAGYWPARHRNPDAGNAARRGAGPTLSRCLHLQLIVRRSSPCAEP
ncbi:MAG: substrate-binding domain-containing protein [Anaerolineae bacterium]